MSTEDENEALRKRLAEGIAERLGGLDKIPYTEAGIALVQAEVERSIREAKVDMPIPMGYTAADARARGEDVPEDVPDCAGAYFYGWEVEEPTEETRALREVRLVAKRPHWRWITVRGTISTE